MKSKTEEDKKISQEIYELRLKGKERYLEIMGIDIRQLREVEQELDKEYTELASRLQDVKREEVNKRAKTQIRNHEKNKSLISQAVEKAINADLTSQNALVEHLYPILHVGSSITADMAMLKFHCHYSTWLSNLDHGDSISLNPPDGGGCKGSVKYNESVGIAQPFVDVQGMGTGTINSTTVNTWFKFAFTPSTDGNYCIRPLVLINGWWLLWTWGTCNPAEDVGIGNMHVKIKVRVDQLSTTLKEIEHVVLKESTTSGGNKEGALYYDSLKDGGASMNVYLEKDHEAVIFVECESFAQVNNHGKAIIDMQGSEGFYFMVDLVMVDRLHFHIWPSH